MAEPVQAGNLDSSVIGSRTPRSEFNRVAIEAQQAQHSKLMDALSELGATVDRENFTARMHDPEFVESVRSALKEGGANVSDSGTFHAKYGGTVGRYPEPPAQAQAQSQEAVLTNGPRYAEGMRGDAQKVFQTTRDILSVPLASGEGALLSPINMLANVVGMGGAGSPNVPYDEINPVKLAKTAYEKRNEGLRTIGNDPITAAMLAGSLLTGGLETPLVATRLMGTLGKGASKAVSAADKLRDFLGMAKAAKEANVLKTVVPPTSAARDIIVGGVKLLARNAPKMGVGAALGAGTSALDAELNPYATETPLRAAYTGAVLGGMTPAFSALLHGSGATDLGRAVNDFPGMLASHNRNVTDADREFIKANLPSILSVGLAPQTKGEMFGIARAMKENAGKGIGLAEQAAITAHPNWLYPTAQLESEVEDLVTGDLGKYRKALLEQDPRGPRGYKLPPEATSDIEKRMDRIKATKLYNIDVSREAEEAAAEKELLDWNKNNPHEVVDWFVPNDPAPIKTQMAVEPKMERYFNMRENEIRTMPLGTSQDYAKVQEAMANLRAQEREWATSKLTLQQLKDLSLAQQDKQTYMNPEGGINEIKKLVGQAFLRSRKSAFDQIPEYKAKMGKASATDMVALQGNPDQQYRLSSALEDLLDHPGNVGLAHRTIKKLPLIGEFYARNEAESPWESASRNWKRGKLKQGMAGILDVLGISPAGQATSEAIKRYRGLAGQLHKRDSTATK